jgi:hypothetical protein
MLLKHSRQLTFETFIPSVHPSQGISDIAGMNYFIADWINTQGPLEVFSIIGGIHIFICILTIPMYIYGKRVRSMTARLPFYKAIMSR